jgi:hypothetical protein
MLTATDAVGDDEVLVKTNDLRKECRAASEDQKGKLQGAVKSPKKKLFGMHLPNFGRSSAPNPPPMPSKAAQVLGHEPRNSKKAVRSGKSAASQETPTKAPRSDTSKSLPVKLLDQDKHARSHHTGATRRYRDISRRSPPRINKLPATAFNPFLGTESSQASAPPPTPPAKDTPPDGRQPLQPASPLRRTAQLDGLREIYKADVDVASGPLRFPAFALSPSPTKTFEAGFAGKSPSKQIPGTAEDYQKLIAGQPLPWPSPLRDDCNPERVGDQPAAAQSKVENTQDTDSLYREDRWSAEKQEHGDSRDAALSYRLSNPPNLPQPNEHSSSEYAPYVYSNHGSHHYSPLQPRFYSPSNRSVLKFADGETPSKNVSPPPLPSCSLTCEIGTVWKAPAYPCLLPPSPSRPTPSLLPHLLSLDKNADNSHSPILLASIALFPQKATPTPTTLQLKWCSKVTRTTSTHSLLPAAWFTTATQSQCEYRCATTPSLRLGLCKSFESASSTANLYTRAELMAAFSLTNLHQDSQTC